MFSDAFGLFCMEQEGELDTTEGRYRKAIHLMKRGVPVSEALEDADLSLEELTEIQLKEVEKYGEI